MTFTVKGMNPSVGGRVWGSNPYTADSVLAAAAVHAGVLRPDEEGVVRVTLLPGQQAYAGSKRNLVETRSWGMFGLSYRIDSDENEFKE